MSSQLNSTGKLSATAQALFSANMMPVLMVHHIFQRVERPNTDRTDVATRDAAPGMLVGRLWTDADAVPRKRDQRDEILDILWLVYYRTRRPRVLRCHSLI